MDVIDEWHDEDQSWSTRSVFHASEPELHAAFVLLENPDGECHGDQHGHGEHDCYVQHVVAFPPSDLDTDQGTLIVPRAGWSRIRSDRVAGCGKPVATATVPSLLTERLFGSTVG
jgi:hypothetical protein